MQTPQTAIVFINLGTPDAPTPASVRCYLREFLSDPRVVELPRWLWWCVLRGVILPFRSKQSAKKYAMIWTQAGSPLRVTTSEQAMLLEKKLRQRGHAVQVAYAMRYGQPSITEVLSGLSISGVARVVILPAYPQYSCTTTASIVDAVLHYYTRQRDIPELHFIRDYHTHSSYIAALKAQLIEHWATYGKPERLLMSFHGTPEKMRQAGDPYHDQCVRTAHSLSQACGLSADQAMLTFQSRFGKAPWLGPSTEDTLKQLAQAGVKQVDVICPGFTSDCLETLEEIAINAKELFIQAGGQQCRLVPCLNTSSAWIEALAMIAEAYLPQ